MTTSSLKSPRRIKDLVEHHFQGAELVLQSEFEIIPAIFDHGKIKFNAFIFLCNYSGTSDDKPFSFRKCYARGCPHNLCPHVIHAVMTANRHLQRDYHVLSNAGIQLEEKLFSLDDMILEYEEIKTLHQTESSEVLTLYDFILKAAEGERFEIEVVLDRILAVEHFANQKNKQTFYMAEFLIHTLEKEQKIQHCFACHKTPGKQHEIQKAVQTANERLESLYEEFDMASIVHNEMFFH